MMGSKKSGKGSAQAERSIFPGTLALGWEGEGPGCVNLAERFRNRSFLGILWGFFLNVHVILLGIGDKE